MLSIQQAIATTLEGYGRFDDIVETLGEEQLSRPTGLAEWQVRDLVAHVAWVQAMEADAIRRAIAGQQSLAGADEVPADAGLAALLDGVRRGREAIVSALHDAPELEPTTPVVIPAGTLPLTGALTLYAVEAGLHARDLAQALGRPDALTTDEVAACAALLRPLLGLAAGTGASPPPGASVALVGETFTERWAARGTLWAPEGEAAGDPATTISGSDEAVVLFAYGRIDHTDDRLRIAGEESVAARFKEFFPGP